MGAENMTSQEPEDEKGSKLLFIEGAGTFGTHGQVEITLEGNQFRMKIDGGDGESKRTTEVTPEEATVLENVLSRLK